VLHGARDRYIPARFGDGLAAALGDGRAEHVEGAGHWPWLDRPELVDRVARFVGG
jgi:pimeloyl-ACP methyl ester carboxylesterase